MMKIKIYVSNLAKYVTGRENGKWLQLPMDTEKLKVALDDIIGFDASGNTMEHIILDYDAPFNVNEYENILTLNETVKELSDTRFDNEELSIFFKVGDSREETINKIIDDEYTIIDVNDYAKDWNCSESEKAGLILHELNLITAFTTPVPEDLVDYVDWEKVFDCECINCGWIEVTTKNTTYLVRG